MPFTDLEARRESQKKYRQSEKGKETRERYRKTEKGKEKEEASRLKYSQSEKGKATKRRNNMKNDYYRIINENGEVIKYRKDENGERIYL